MSNPGHNQFIEFEGVRYYFHKLSGYYRSNGYKQKARRLHNVVWEFYNGPILKGYVVHHEDENKCNNNISNLILLKNEEHTSLHGKQNLGKKHKRNTSGAVGVSWDDGAKKWRARIKKQCLGCFNSKDEASKAYTNALELYKHSRAFIS